MRPTARQGKMLTIFWQDCLHAQHSSASAGPSLTGNAGLSGNSFFTLFQAIAVLDSRPEPPVAGAPCPAEVGQPDSRCGQIVQKPPERGAAAGPDGGSVRQDGTHGHRQRLASVGFVLFGRSPKQGALQPSGVHLPELPANLRGADVGHGIRHRPCVDLLRLRGRLENPAPIQHGDAEDAVCPGGCQSSGKMPELPLEAFLLCHRRLLQVQDRGAMATPHFWLRVR